VSAGFGIGVVSQSLTCLTLPNIVFRKLAVPKAPLSPIGCVHRSNETAPAVQAFIQAMRRRRIN
jgi:DNA-binding transcriptional LysR family regulator